MKHVFAVIMAGGVGSRFWPTSRAATPKQLLDLTGSGQTMIQATVDRLQPHIPPDRVLVVTGEITRQAVIDALPDVPEENVLAEPVGRNTAPCIGWAALHVKRRDPQGVLMVLPSDHLVTDKEAFLASARLGIQTAGKGALVTFGVTPRHPETGFGYIEVIKPSDSGGEGVYKVRRFIEKPDLATAKKYVAAGNFYWNSGIFFLGVDDILGEIAHQLPELSAGLDEIDAAIDAGNEADVVGRVYPRLLPQSVDYGIMEGAKEIQCVPVEFGWSDLGSWAAAYELSKKDQNENAADEDTIAINATGNLVRIQGEKMVALVGVTDLVVIDAEDALLVCTKESAQDVKQAVNELKKRGRLDLL